MNRNLILKEIKDNRKSFFIWTGVISLVTFFLLSLYPSMAEMKDTMEAMIKGMPSGMADAFGMTDSYFSGIVGYYSTYYGLHVMILSGIFVISMAGNIIAKEEREGTADFLLTKPLTRGEVITSKLVAYGSLVALYFIIQTGLSVMFISAYGENPDWGQFTIMIIYGVMLNFFFAGIGLFLSLLPRKGRSLTGPLIAVVIGGFVLNAFARISKDTEWLGWVSPFKYPDFNVGAADYGLEPWRVLVLVGIGAICITLVYLHYRKKDIYV